jgi:hypothetical protein
VRSRIPRLVFQPVTGRAPLLNGVLCCFSVAGVFDGHGAVGHEVASFVSTELPSFFLKQKNLDSEPVSCWLHHSRFVFGTLRIVLLAAVDALCLLADCCAQAEAISKAFIDCNTQLCKQCVPNLLFVSNWPGWLLLTIEVFCAGPSIARSLAQPPLRFTSMVRASTCAISCSSLLRGCGRSHGRRCTLFLPRLQATSFTRAMRAIREPCWPRKPRGNAFFTIAIQASQVATFFVSVHSGKFKAVGLSVDHKPERADEKKRIIECKGRVEVSSLRP